MDIKITNALTKIDIKIIDALTKRKEEYARMLDEYKSDSIF